MTIEQKEAAIQIYLAVAEAIRSATLQSPLKGAPAGEVYVCCMSIMSYMTFETMIASMITAGLVKRTNHLLTWVGDDLKIN